MTVQDPAVPATAPRVRIVGRGRAGGSFIGALTAAGWSVDPIAHDAPDLNRAADDVDLVLLCVPDAAIAVTAAAIDAVEGVAVAHCAGAAALDVLAPHGRRASVHPLVSLPDAVVGGRRLPGAWFAIAGDDVARQVVDALGGHAVEVPDEARVRYHAAAAIASNHLVALLGQVERVAAGVGVPLVAFLDLARGSLDNVAERGPRAALTGPVARGDVETVRAHLAALPEAERAAYLALADQAARLVGRHDALDTGPDGTSDLPAGAS